MNKYPIKFIVKSESIDGVHNPWLMQTKDYNGLQAAIPQELNGPGEGLSPEDLYALSLLNCFIATFKIFAEKNKVEFKSIEGSLELTVDKGDFGKLIMKTAQFNLTINSCENKDKIEQIVEKTKENCIVMNSVITSKIFNIIIN